MKNFDLEPTYENIKKTLKDNIIGRNEELYNFFSILDSIDGNMSIALDSGWGTGKTFFVKQIETLLNYYYGLSKNKQDNEIIAIFTLSNDSVVIDNIEDKEDFVLEAKNKISDEYISTFERQTSFPAINIGHLGVHKDCQSKGIGQQILDFVLYTFSNYNMSGCQFITVDSLNNPRTNKFYLRNGFINQTNNDIHDLTRRMYQLIQLFMTQE
mgnify:CR=1 FL=1